jgi:hypothetical protein
MDKSGDAHEEQEFSRVRYAAETKQAKDMLRDKTSEWEAKETFDAVVFDAPNLTAPEAELENLAARFAMESDLTLLEQGIAEFGLPHLAGASRGFGWDLVGEGTSCSRNESKLSHSQKPYVNCVC